MNIDKIEACIEAVLFAYGSEVSLEKLSNALEVDEKTLKSVIKRMSDRYHQEQRGIQIIEINDAYQMCTNSEYFEYISKIAEIRSKKILSPALLETLAIIAYKQPITKGEIEEIRGVNADHAVNKLMEYNLINEKGRKDTPGKPILFVTSDEFLRYFGFKNLGELPNMEEIKISPEGIEL